MHRYFSLTYRPGFSSQPSGSRQAQSFARGHQKTVDSYDFPYLKCALSRRDLGFSTLPFPENLSRYTVSLSKSFESLDDSLEMGLL